MKTKKSNSRSVKKPKKAVITTLSENITINPTHRQVIDAYFINGFRKTAAMMEVKPDITYNSAAVMVNSIFEDERNKAYIQEKRSQLRASTDLRNENILRELINWAYCDVTEFMTLTEDEIKALPPDMRRCIQSFKSYTKTTYNPITKETTTTKTLEIKAISKENAMTAAAKHIGFFLLDNEQKRTKINLEKVDVNILNGFLSAIEYQDNDIIEQ